MADPQPGDYFVVRTNGWAGVLIRWVTRSTVNHAGILVNGGAVVEARPAGAGYAAARDYTAATWSHFPLTDAQRVAIIGAANGLVGTPYSWVDCACVGLADLFGINVPEPVRKRLRRRDRLMCSQLVDTAYLDAGVHLFSDGRIPGAVSPGDLLNLIPKE